MLHANKRAKQQQRASAVVATPTTKQAKKLKRKSTLSTTTRVQRSFSTTLSQPQHSQQTNENAANKTKIGRGFKSTKKPLKNAFPDDYHHQLNPQPPERDQLTFENSKLIADLDPKFLENMQKSKNYSRRFDNSEDSELYDMLKNEDGEDQTKPKPTFEDYAKAKVTLHHLNQSDVVDWSNRDNNFPWLDPFNPPNLTYQHVKLLKNIDYSPLIKRANEGGMFTVEDVITILQEEGVSDAFKTSMRREHAQDPVIYGKTFDVFNRGRKPCPLCLPDPTQSRVNRIHWTNVNLLRKFISTSGMILPRKVSGVCTTHQTKLRYAIKNAKQLALLSFTSNWHVPLSYVDPSKFDSYEDQHAAADVERERRMEIRALFDNLVADKKAILAGKSIEDLEQERDAAEQRDALQLEKANAAAVEAGEAPVLQGKELEANVREQQKDAKIKQIQEKYEAQLTKAGKDEEQVAAIKKAYAEEEKNVNDDYERAVAEANDENLDTLRSDFGELLNLDTFDLGMDFEEFLGKYNERVVAKGVRYATHEEVLVLDSDEELTPAMRLRQDQVEDLVQRSERARDLKH